MKCRECGRFWGAEHDANCALSHKPGQPAQLFPLHVRASECISTAVPRVVAMAQDECAEMAVHRRLALEQAERDRAARAARFQSKCWPARLFSPPLTEDLVQPPELSSITLRAYYTHNNWLRRVGL
jgi:hypothetical protein